MDSVTLRNQFPRGSCFSIQPSQTCQELKEDALLLVNGVALAAIAGGVIAYLALNGIDFGGINSLVKLIGEEWIVTAIAGGLALWVLNSALITALIRSYYNNQFTTEEIAHLNLNHEFLNSDLYSKLDPGHFWLLSEDYDRPVRVGDQTRPAIFGALVRDHDGTFGVYAYKTRANLFALFSKNGYKSGEVAFQNSEKFSLSYIATKLNQEDQHFLNKGNFDFEKVCETWEFNIQEAGKEEKTLVYALRQGKKEPCFFKTERDRANKMPGLLKLDLWPDDWIQDCNEVKELKYLRFKNASSYFALPVFQQDGNDIYALRYPMQVQGVNQPLYFKTEEARAQFITTNLSSYDNAIAIYQAADPIANDYSIPEIFQTPGVDCWEADPTQIGERTYYLLFIKDEDKRNVYLTRYFRTENERTDFITNQNKDAEEGKHLVPLNTIIDLGGKCKADWVQQNVSSNNRQIAENAAVDNNQHRLDSCESNNGEKVFWVTAQNNDGIRTTDYFPTVDAALKHTRTYLGGSLDLTARELLVEEFQDKHLLNLALSQNDDFWGTTLNGLDQRAHVLFTKTQERIVTTYPNALPRDENLHNIQHMIEVQGEYPKALGEHLTPLDENQKKRESCLLKNEFWSWKPEKTTHQAYSSCQVVQFKDGGGNYTVRFFSKTESAKNARNGFTNGFLRQKDQLLKAVRWSIAVNSRRENKTDHRVCIVNGEQNQLVVFIPKTVPDKKGYTPEYFYVGLNDDKNKENFIDIGTQYNDLADLDKAEKVRFEEYEAKSELRKAFGDKLDNPSGKLQRARHATFEKNGVFGLLWLTDEEPPQAKRDYFKTRQAREDYINANLGGISPQQDY